MNIYKSPILFALLAVVIVLIGTLVTAIVPIFMPSTQPPGGFVKPYTAIELEGRDLYIREGCNNCHTQTVRPLVTEVARYGDYSKPEESAYDRPFLWGSRRTGPDLSRVGGKYPDSWHYQHMQNPQAMFPKSNMPAYRWLSAAKLDTSLSVKKVAVLGYGFSEQEVKKQLDDYRAMVTSPTYPSKDVRDKVVAPELRGELTELDAMIAYMQKLGRDLKHLTAKTAPHPAEAASADLKNPFAGKPDAVEEGKKVYAESCAACHGPAAKGGIGPDLTKKEKKFGNTDADVFASVAKGRSGGMPDWEKGLGSDRIWKAIAFLRTLEK